MRISDWSSDVCSSDLDRAGAGNHRHHPLRGGAGWRDVLAASRHARPGLVMAPSSRPSQRYRIRHDYGTALSSRRTARGVGRSEEHTSELQSLMRISYAVFCLKKTISSTIHYALYQKHHNET